MKQSSSPSVITTPFGNSGSKNTIPETSLTGATDGLASWSTGFPDSTMTPISAGGIPPHGKDFNGVLYAISNAMQWEQIGGLYQYSQSIANSIGGYPKGAIVLGSDGSTIYESLSDSNSNDPDSSLGSSFWKSLTKLSLTISGDVHGSFSGDQSSASLNLSFSQVMVSGSLGTTTGDLAGRWIHWDTGDGYPVFGYGTAQISYVGLATRDYVKSGTLTGGYWSQVGNVLTISFRYDTTSLGEASVTFPKSFSGTPVVTHSYRDSADGVSAISNIQSITSTSVTFYNRALNSSGWVNSTGTLWITATGPA